MSLLSFFPNSEKRFLAQAYDELLRKAIQLKADLYIGHNPGALAVVAEAARKLNSRFAFDAEDYHRGELSKDHPTSTKIHKIETLYLPNAVYVTVASPLIGKYYSKVYEVETITINNVFSKNYQAIFNKVSRTSTLKFFWFSQTIGSDRGLEDFFGALEFLEEIHIEITLLGTITNIIKLHFLDLTKSKNHKLIFLPPCSERELFQLCSNYDIGLALERDFPINRDICLTNKLFTYLLSGIAVILSNTQAQKSFLNQYPDSGCRIYDIGDTFALAEIIRYWYEHPEKLENDKKNAWQLAKDRLNWEKESELLVSLIKKIE